MAKNIKAKNKIESAISRLICFQPLYGTVFLHLNKVQTDKLPTMGVGVMRRVDLGLFCIFLSTLK